MLVQILFEFTVLSIFISRSFKLRLSTEQVSGEIVSTSEPTSKSFFLQTPSEATTLKLETTFNTVTYYSNLLLFSSHLIAI